MTSAAIVSLAGRPELVDQLREAVVEFLRLPDSWARELLAGTEIPDFLRDELAALPEDPSPPDGAVLMALQDDRVVGTAQIRRMDDGVCELKRMYVQASHQRSGIGRDLVEGLITQAASMGYEQIYLDVTTNRPGAIAFYRSLGFAETESRHDYGHAVVSMIRDVAP